MRDFADRAPKAAERLEEGFDDAMAAMALPGKYRKRLRTTNGVERLILPNEESAQRLIGAVLIEIDVDHRAPVL